MATARLEAVLLLSLFLLLGVEAAPADINCDFESGTLCQWKPADTDIVDHRFEVATHASLAKQLSPPLFGPSANRTRGGSPNGHFAYISNPSYKSEKISASILAPNPFPQQTVCFEFNYFFYTVGRASSILLSAIIEDENKPEFWAFGGNVEGWRQARRTIQSNKTITEFSIQTNIYQGLVAIDDIRVQSGACSTAEPADLSQLCTFEYGSDCQFNSTHLREGWKVYSGYDHTTSDGSALSRWTHYGEHLKLAWTPIDGRTYRCFGFSLYNSDVAAKIFFNANYQNSSDSQNHTLHWEILYNIADKGDKWQTWTISLPKIDNLELILGLERLTDKSTSDYGSSYIDDILLDTSECLQPYDCDFEKGTACSLESLLPKGWISDKISPISIPKNTQVLTRLDMFSADSMWHVFEPAQSLSVFASTDHTLQSSNGKYLLLVGDQDNKSERRDYSGRAVISTSINLHDFHSGHVCLRMFVYKPTNINTVLEVYQSESNSPAVAVKLFELRPNQFADRWVPVEISGKVQSRLSSSMSFYIVGTVQLNGTIDKNSYIAIDDISVRADCAPHSATEFPTHAPPTVPTHATETVQ